MLRPRIVVCLLTDGESLIKTRKFKSDRYLGDPLNAIKIFNELEVDELILLDIDAQNIIVRYLAQEKMAHIQQVLQLT